jgi:hypothetical protein
MENPKANYETAHTGSTFGQKPNGNTSGPASRPKVTALPTHASAGTLRGTVAGGSPMREKWWELMLNHLQNMGHTPLPRTLQRLADGEWRQWRSSILGRKGNKRGSLPPEFFPFYSWSERRGGGDPPQADRVGGGNVVRRQRAACALLLDGQLKGGVGTGLNVPGSVL